MSQKVFAGRRLVDAYRTAHTKIYEAPWRRSVPKEHTPLLNAMMKGLNGLGFTELKQFFNENGALVRAELDKMYQRTGECNYCGKCCEGCEHHIPDDFCAIYETRPQICVEYPTTENFHMGSVPEECSFSFTRTEYQPEVDVSWK